MKSVSKIIGSSLSVNSELVHFDKIVNSKHEFQPELIIIDQTVIDIENQEIISIYNNKFPSAKVLIITLDEEWKLNEIYSEREDIEILNLWRSNPSLSKTLLVVIKKLLI